MKDFFSDQVGQTIEFFGLTHILLIVGFFIALIVLWSFSPRIKASKNEKWFRYGLIALVMIFEWRVFESRMLENSIFRMPLCAVALYGLTFSVALKKEKVFKIFYFFAFGSFLSYLFYDTPFGLDRWFGWTFFGAHLTIALLAVYGFKVLGYVPNKKDFFHSFLFLLGYSVVSAYATLRFGGADEMFLINPAVDFLISLRDFSQVLYTLSWSAFAFAMMVIMYIPILISDHRKRSINKTLPSESY